MLQMFKDDSLSELYSPLLSDDEPANEAVSQISQLLSETDLTAEENWPRLSRKITEILIPFIPENPDALPALQPCGAFDKVDRSAPPVEINPEDISFENGVLFPKRHALYERLAESFDAEALLSTAEQSREQIHVPVQFETAFRTSTPTTHNSIPVEHVLV